MLLPCVLAVILRGRGRASVYACQRGPLLLPLIFSPFCLVLSLSTLPRYHTSPPLPIPIPFSYVVHMHGSPVYELYIIQHRALLLSRDPMTGTARTGRRFLSLIISTSLLEVLFPHISIRHLLHCATLFEPRADYLTQLSSRMRMRRRHRPSHQPRPSSHSARTNTSTSTITARTYPQRRPLCSHSLPRPTPATRRTLPSRQRRPTTNDSLFQVDNIGDLHLCGAQNKVKCER